MERPLSKFFFLDQEEGGRMLLNGFLKLKMNTDFLWRNILKQTFEKRVGFKR
jgi:hypothetical protein